MKNILIVASGELAKHFLHRLFSSKNNNLHNFTLIADDDTMPSDKINFENFNFFNFDPTSKYKLQGIMNVIYEKAIIIIQDKDEAIAVYQNIHEISPKLEIDLLDFWGLDLENYYLKLIDANKILSSRLMDFLPDFPIIADNIGLSGGEIMEIKVPVGSAYAYRYIRNINQKLWNIALIYRNKTHILPNRNTMILPNDNLLVVGEPRMLENVFRAIKNQVGQFPNPFGNNILLFLDFTLMSQKQIDILIKNAIFLSSNLKNKKLIIKVLNPILNEQFEKIKNLKDKNISILISYVFSKHDYSRAFMKEFDIGLIITNSKFFYKKKRLLHDCKVPILKTNDKEDFKITKGLFVGNQYILERLSSVIIDFCKQMDLGLDFYLLDNNNDNEYFLMLSKLFNKKINIISIDQNPILKLRKNDDFIQFINFSKKVLENKILSYFSKDSDKVSFMLDKNYQLFIPSDDKD